MSPGGADWDEIYSRVDLTGLQIGEEGARAAIDSMLANAPVDQVKAAAAKVREAAAQARSDRELVVDVIQLVGKLAVLA